MSHIEKRPYYFDNAADVLMRSNRAVYALLNHGIKDKDIRKLLENYRTWNEMVRDGERKMLWGGRRAAVLPARCPENQMCVLDKTVAYFDKEWPRRLEGLEDPPCLMEISGQFSGQFSGQLRTQVVGVLGNKYPSMRAIQATVEIVNQLIRTEHSIITLDEGVGRHALKIARPFKKGISVSYGRGAVSLSAHLNGGILQRYNESLWRESNVGIHVPSGGVLQGVQVISGLCKVLVIIESGMHRADLEEAHKIAEQAGTKTLWVQGDETRIERQTRVDRHGIKWRDAIEILNEE